MTILSRRAVVRILAAGGGLLGVGAAGGYMLRRPFGRQQEGPKAATRDLRMAMMGHATAVDMSTYADLFSRHTELRRTVQPVPGGVRTVTEADSAYLTAQLQAHVASMYGHLEHGTEVTCMSTTLPTLFANATRYRRVFTTTTRGVAVTETSDDPRLAAAIRAHADEVTGFVDAGMPAMMGGMIGGQPAG